MYSITIEFRISVMIFVDKRSVDPLNSHIMAPIKRMDEDRFMVVGGRSSLFYYEGDLPNQYAQIIKIKK